YGIRNGIDAKQYIVSLSTYISNANSGYPTSPEGWLGALMPNVKPPYLKLSWSHMGKNRDELMSGKRGGIASGKSSSGFALESNDLPGVASVEIEGDPTTQSLWL